MDGKRYALALSILLAASFVANLGFSAFGPVLPYLILALKGVLEELPELVAGTVEAHKGAVEFGMLTAAFMATRAPMAAVVGILSDAFGRKRTMLAGMTLYFAVSLGFLLSNDILLFALFRALQGAASAMVWPVAEAYIADITPKWSRGKALSAYVSSMFVAEIAGPAVGVAVYKLYVAMFGSADLLAALKSPIAFLAISCLASAIAMGFLPSINAREPSGGGCSWRAALEGVLGSLKALPPGISRSIKAIYVNGFVNGIAMGIIQTAAITYIIEEVAKDPLYIGLFISVMSAVALPATMVAGYVSDRMQKRKPIALLGYILGRSTFFALPFAKSPEIVLALGALFGVLFGLSAPVMRALQADLSTQAVRGTVFGVQQFFFNSGTFAGALLGGWLTREFARAKLALLGYEVGGYAAPFWLAALLGLAAVAVFAVYVEESP